jgi:TolB-like protein/Tfp pilus assembly protein PilF
MEFRIGINLGDVIEEDDRIYGDGVNIAARLEALADPGGICISKTAFDYIENKLPFGYRFIGDQPVKNIAKPIGAYKVLMETRLIDEEEQRAKASIWKRRAVLSIGVIVILAIVIVLYWNFYPRELSIKPDSIKPEQETVFSDVKDVPKSIAVLPFDDLSPKKDQEYFVDGVSEEILNSLAQIPDLIVIAKTSSFSFKDQNKTIQEIANALGVNHILEGSVRKAGNALRITAQLINTVDGSHLWSKAYDKPFKVEEIFSVQEDIASKVADELKLTLGIGSLRQLGGTDNTAAYEYYLNAKGQLYNRQEENALRSIDSALSLDPKFALAWALKATAHSRISGGEVSNSRIVKELDESLRSAQKAIELEPNLAEAHFALGRYNTSKLNWINAELAYQKAFELTTDVLSRNEFEPFFHYMCVGYFEKAKRALEAQLKNDPFNMNSYYYYLNILVGYVGDIQKAKEENERAKELFKEKGEWPGDSVLIATRISRGEIVPKDEIDEDTLAFHNAIGVDLESPEKSLEAIHEFYTSLGDEIPAGTLGTFGIYAAFFGDYDFALELIEKSGVQRVNNIIFLWIPVMEEARKLPQFKEFVREIGLIDYWKEYGWNDFCHPVGDDDFECD